MTWALFFTGVAAVTAGAWWIVHSFKKWPATPGEGRSFLWSKRGGGDM